MKTGLPRLSILFEYPTLSGGERSMLAVLPQLRYDFELQLILPANSPIEELARSLQFNGLTYQFPAADHIQQTAARQAAISQSIAEFQPELIHANSLSMGKFLGRIKSTLPCRTSTHLRDMIKLNATQCRDLTQHDGIIAVSQATAQYYYAQGFPHDKITAIYNGIDLTTFYPAIDRPDGSLHQELDIPSSHHIAVTIGQICLRKGIDTLIEALIQCHALNKSSSSEFKQWHFVIIGDRFSTKQETIEYALELNSKIETHNLSQQVHFLDYRTDISAVLREAELLIHPARQEPLGRVLLEAAATGLPILATNVGGTSEILIHQKSGWLIEPGQPAALAAALLHLIENAGLRFNLGQAATHEITARFSVQRAAESLKTFWNSLLVKNP